MTDDPRPGFNALPGVQLSAPERVYLNVCDDASERGNDFGLYSEREVTWSRDEAMAVAVPYVRADLVNAGTAVADEQIEAVAQAMAECFDYPWDYMPGQGREEMRKHARTVLARAALAAPKAEALQWLPIEQAPKDGRPLMGCFWEPTLPHLYSPRRIHWATYHPNAAGEICWRDSNVCGNKLKRLTHYAELPAPPAHQGATHHE